MKKKRARTGSLHEAIALFTSACLRTYLAEARGKIIVAAERAGRNRSEFYRLLKRHGIDHTEFRTPPA